MSIFHEFGKFCNHEKHDEEILAFLYVLRHPEFIYADVSVYEETSCSVEFKLVNIRSPLKIL